MFDIILPSIGRPSLIAAVDSVLKQTYPNWRLFVMLDMKHVSLDRAEQLERWIFNKNDARLNSGHLVSDIPNICGTEARNGAIRLSEMNDPYPWITYLDDDDAYLPHRLEHLISVMNDRPDINMIKTAGQEMRDRHRHPRSSELVRKLGQVNVRDIMTVGMAHTRKIFEKTDGWKPDPHRHDAILWQDMLNVGGTPFISDEVTFLYHRR